VVMPLNGPMPIVKKRRLSNLGGQGELGLHWREEGQGRYHALA
jgi:hypothetical protein